MVGKKTKEDSIKNKVVVVTGATGGIGRCIAEGFAEKGANVCLHFAHNEKSARQLRERLLVYTSKVSVYQEDFLSDDILLIQKVLAEHQRVDILVNSAGILGKSSILSVGIEELQSLFRINTFAPYILSRDAFLAMKQRKWGRIVNIGSIAVRYGMGRNMSIHYAGSKAASESLTTGLARLGAPHNILINTIRPGVVNTSMQKHRANLDERIAMIPLKRIGEAKEIAEMVLYLCSVAGDFITGQTISISGGE